MTASEASPLIPRPDEKAVPVAATAEKISQGAGPAAAPAAGPVLNDP